MAIRRPPSEHAATTAREYRLARGNAARREVETTQCRLEATERAAFHLRTSPLHEVRQVGREAQVEQHLSPRVRSVLEVDQGLVAIGGAKPQPLHGPDEAGLRDRAEMRR